MAGIPAPVLSLVLSRVSGSTTLGRSGTSFVAPDTFRNRIVKILGERDIGRDGEVNNPDAGVLAHRYAEPLGNPDIFQDIGKLAAGYRACLRRGGFSITRSTSGGRRMTASGKPGRWLGKGFVYTGLVRRLHSIILMIGE